MSTRPVSPPPVSRWPYYTGAIVLMATAAIVLAVGEKPPGYAVIAAATISVMLSAGLWIVPELLNSESRLRMAEAGARNNGEFQARRLAQVAEQLANAVSRSQSTEEQAGQALGTLEEMVERLSGQSDEIAQTLARNSDREQQALTRELETLHRERAEVLAALASRLQTLETAATESVNAAKRASATTNRMLSQLAEQIDELGLRLEALEAGATSREPASVPDVPIEPLPATLASTAAPPAAPQAAVPIAEPLPATVAVAPEVPPAAAPAPEPVVEPPSVETTPESVEDAPIDDEPTEPEASADPVEMAAPEPEEAPTKPVARPRAKPVAPAPEKRAPVPPPAAIEPMELALEGMPEPRAPMRIPKRPAPGVTSLVATAYIGIGNKLYVRGEGPGLSWEEGVPMQFLAIGKWGWTTTDAAERVVARIYRNDETPMLDEDIILEPGSRADVAPRF